MYVCMYVYKYVCMYVRMYACMFSEVRSCVGGAVYAYIHTYIHTYIHIVYIYIYLRRGSSCTHTTKKLVGVSGAGSPGAAAGTKFTCFIGTKVQILTQLSSGGNRAATVATELL